MESQTRCELNPSGLNVFEGVRNHTTDYAFVLSVQKEQHRHFLYTSRLNILIHAIIYTNTSPFSPLYEH